MNHSFEMPSVDSSAHRTPEHSSENPEARQIDSALATIREAIDANALTEKTKAELREFIARLNAMN